ncbi:hypothetical protein ABIC27_004439, partial [Streptomyces sp. PvR034]
MHGAQPTHFQDVNAGKTGGKLLIESESPERETRKRRTGKRKAGSRFDRESDTKESDRV